MCIASYSRKSRAWGVALLLFLISALALTDAAVGEERSTVDLLVPSSPGGSRDVYARLMARYMRKHLPGNPAIIVKNMPGAGGDIMLNYLYHRAKRDGYTFATGTNAMYRAQRLGLKSARYEIDKFTFLGALPESPYMLLIRNDSPVKSFSELDKAKKPVFYGTESLIGGGSTEMFGFLLIEKMGAKLKFVPGYRGSNLRMAAVLKGELDSTLDRLSTSEPFIEEGKVRALVVLTHAEEIPPKTRGNAPAWFELDLTPEVRQLSDFIVTPTDLDKTYLAPPGVPADRVKQLRHAFQEAAREPEVKKILAERGAVGSIIPGEELQNKVVPRLYGVKESTVDTIKRWLAGGK